jgi:lipopolysaccharide/colanic/teichoic acid biosynthesis glycosyltransferase
MARRSEATKRAIDIVGAVVALAAVAPLMLVIAVLIATTMGRPVLFRQTRIGRGARPFTIVKFRTMHPVDARRGLVSDGERLTALGRALRRSSLDELPNLWNVVLGQMSLVGPRPLIVRDLHEQTPRQARRHDVRPGVTGLAQVRGRNLLTRTEQFDLDVWYVENRSVAADVRILADTARIVLRGEGVTSLVNLPGVHWSARRALTEEISASDEPSASMFRGP